MIELFEDGNAKIKKIQESYQTPYSADLFGSMDKIRQSIHQRGDEAVIDFTKEFDAVQLTASSMWVQPEEIQNATQVVSQSFVGALSRARSNIEAFHQRQLPSSWKDPEDHASDEKNRSEGRMVGQRFSALEKVCLYVPGGRAPYPSTVLMDVIPAKIAGVQDIFIATPPRSDGTVAPEILVAAEQCGVSRILKVGGAQAVFAFAYGTESIPKVDKIVGPGNQYVTIAKQMVYGAVDIDKPAGPSEALVYIENKDYVSYAAAELLAQLEHDPCACAIGISPDQSILQEIQQEMKQQIQQCNRRLIIEEAVQNSALLLANSRSHAIEMINACASEHTVLLVDDYDQIEPHVKHAGALFLGPYTPVALGDYYAGPNHVLPTAGTARFASPLNVMDFMKFTSLLSYSKEQLSAVREDMNELTQVEGFDAHFRSVSIRLD